MCVCIHVFIHMCTCKSYKCNFMCPHVYLRTHMKCIYNVSPSPLSSELPEGVKLGALANSVGLPAWLWVFS